MPKRASGGEEPFNDTWTSLTITVRKRASQEDLAGDGEPPVAKRPRKAKTYIPAYRSGAHALIIALSRPSQNQLQSYTKAELLDFAQPYCDSSFTAPSESGKHYTAWSSMTTLVDKSLVHERGRPMRLYTLTDEGWELAKKIRGVERKGDSATEEMAGSMPRQASKSGQGKVPAPSSFVDLEENSEHGLSLASAARKPSRDPSVPPSNSQAVNGPGRQLGTDPSQWPDKGRVLDESAAESNKFASGYRGAGAQEIRKAPPSFSSRSDGFSAQTMAGSTDTNSGIRATELPPFDPVILPPGSFTVRLLLDRREIFQKSEERVYISDELEKRGVKPLLRSLELGDFFWVAKVHDPAVLASHGEEGNEIALDWIVERKRLDDLIHSIIDKRFQEQKFRLRKSGVQNVVYLIEQFKIGDETKQDFQQKISSAIASTQVVDGFFVKKTHAIDETIRYIARLTMMLKNLYESKPLYLIPSRVVTLQNYLPLLTHLRADQSRSHHVNYSLFATLSSKSDMLNLRDVFLKMLMCTRGISGEKALAIQKVWKTPQTFIEALERCSSAKEKDALVESKLGNLVGAYKIKGALSAKVAGIWGEG